MILTGKCKEKFLSEYYKKSIENNWDLNELEYIFNMLPKTCQNALIIEFFDSVGIYIEVNKDNMITEKWINNLNSFPLYNSRQEATEQAIIKANNVYNENIHITKICI